MYSLLFSIFPLILQLHSSLMFLAQKMGFPRLFVQHIHITNFTLCRPLHCSFKSLECSNQTDKGMNNYYMQSMMVNKEERLLLLLLLLLLLHHHHHHHHPCYYLCAGYLQLYTRNNPFLGLRMFCIYNLCYR